MPIDNHPFTNWDIIGVPAPLLPVRIINPLNNNDYSTFALLDTGAHSTTIPGYIAEDIGHDIKNVPGKKVYGVSGEVISYPHTFIIEVLVQNPDAPNPQDDCKLVRKIKKKVEVVEGLPIPILGAWDFMNKYVVTFDYPGLNFSVKLPKKKNNTINYQPFDSL